MAEVNAVEKQPVTQHFQYTKDHTSRASNYHGAAELY